MKGTIILLLSLTLVISAKERPNIVFLFFDDLGYGDVQILNPERGKIPTPHMDKLAKSGMIFTDAHSGSSVCTPTRYNLLTGRYSWRSRKQTGVSKGFLPNLIAPDRPTVANFLQDQGYHTALIGKWHLNFQYTDPETGALLKRHEHKLAPVGSKIPDGPITRGFDYFHGIHHARDMEAVIDGDTVIEYDDPIHMLPRVTKKSISYLKERAQSPETPFFLYVPFGSPHKPILPTQEWQNKSGINEYGDFVMQNDDSVGQILAALDELKLRDNTLIILSSDNGCSTQANFKIMEEKGHYPSAQYRGAKASLWEGGHRIPFFASWKGKIKAGEKNDSTICLGDFFATCVELLDAKVPGNSCEDSVSFLPALNQKEIITSRKRIIHHSMTGHFSYRKDDWKLLLAYGSAGGGSGVNSPKEMKAKEEGAPKAQLYNLKEDPSEENNLYLNNPEKYEELLKELTHYVFTGRSTEGPPSKNDTDSIRLWKSE